MIPYGRQEITEDDINAVVSVLNSDFLTQGPRVPQFEQSICEQTGARYCLALNSATSALHLACLALDVGPGDLVWTTPISFVASANCAVYCGADVDFVDIDSRTFNLCADAFENKLKQAEILGKLPKVLIPVHMCGTPCNMERIRVLATRYGVSIIEDASHAIGGNYGTGTPIGSGEYSDITVFSFHPVKIITTGEGGALCTNSAALAERIALLRSHGITREVASNDENGKWFYEQIDLGYNYRMTDLQAALGSSQIRRLAQIIDRRHSIAKKYDEAFSSSPLSAQKRSDFGRSALHLYVVRLHSDCSRDRKRVYDGLLERGIGANVHYIPIHLQPFYQKRGFSRGDYPVAEGYYASALTLPLFPTLSMSAQECVINSLNELLN